MFTTEERSNGILVRLHRLLRVALIALIVTALAAGSLNVALAAIQLCHTPISRYERATLRSATT